MVLSGLSVSACRALLQRHLRRVALATATGITAAGLAACGSSTPSNTSVNATHLLSQTFGANFAEIHSGDLALTISADLRGLKSLHGQPVSLQLSGPFTEHAGTATAFDFAATVTVDGTTLPVGLLSTGNAIYLEVVGTYYKLPPSIGSSLTRSVASTGTTASSLSLLTKLGIDPRSWLTNPAIVGTKTVGGVVTDHLTAKLDVTRLLSDFAKLAGEIPGVSGSSLAGALSPSNLGQLASAVTSARVDVYSGAGDHVLREFATAISFTVPPVAQKPLEGITGGSLDLDLTITNLNAPETITAPSSSEPFSDLLGGTGGLGSL
jgi:hypothetical protein